MLRKRMLEIIKDDLRMTDYGEPCKIIIEDNGDGLHKKLGRKMMVNKTMRWFKVK